VPVFGRQSRLDDTVDSARALVSVARAAWHYQSQFADRAAPVLAAMRELD
jgi:hypothetical protein